MMKRLALAAPLLALPAAAFAQSCPVQEAPAKPAAAASQAQPPRVPTVAEVPYRRMQTTEGLLPVEKFMKDGAEVYDLGVAHGLRSVWVLWREDARWLSFTITPDGKAAIGGMMISATGPNEQRQITRNLLAPIPGMTPTADLRGQQQSAARRINADAPEAWAALQGSSHGLVGREGATRVYMLFDPLCPHSAGAFDEMRPMIDVGAVQVALVPVPMLDPSGTRLSGLATTALLAGPPEDMATSWQHIRSQPASVATVRPDASPEHVARNWKAARALGDTASPTFVWRDQSGKGQWHVGRGIGGALAAP